MSSIPKRIFLKKRTGVRRKRSAFLPPASSSLRRYRKTKQKKETGKKNGKKVQTADTTETLIYSRRLCECACAGLRCRVPGEPTTTMSKFRRLFHGNGNKLSDIHTSLHLITTATVRRIELAPFAY